MSNILRSQDGDAVLAHVAGNLRALRAAAGLSQAQLAERAGISRRMLVAVEGGDTNVSLAKLARVAAALRVPFARLVSAPPAAGPRDAGPLLWRGAAPESRAALMGAAPGGRDPEFWLWSIAPLDSYRAEPDPPGWREALFVIEGSLDLAKADGDATIPAGGFTLFRSDQPYAYRNPGPALLRFTRTVLS
jgi:transcriptional regulator with XRE-family HTH domain